MDVKNLADELKNKAGEVENLMRRKLPVIVGRMAKDHFQTGFRQGGFQDNGTHAWQRKKRTVFTIRELLRKVRELQYHKDTTVGLWCIDRNPKTVSKQWIDENAFQL